LFESLPIDLPAAELERSGCRIGRQRCIDDDFGDTQTIAEREIDGLSAIVQADFSTTRSRKSIADLFYILV
jgi:hypothetical protein